MKFVKMIIACLFPPLGAFLAVGLRPAFWVNILLTCLLWLPGAMHAIFLIETQKK